MALSDLIAARKDSAGGGKALQDGHEGEPPASVPPAEEPYGVAQVVTPSGLEIFYQAGPKRLYRIRNTFRGPEVDIPTDWREVPSVSRVLDVLGKTLQHWGERVGATGAVQTSPSWLPQWSDWPDDAESFATQVVVPLLKANGLSVTAKKNQAAGRGTNVHSALEIYCETGVLPDPKLFPENERGYVQGLVAFLKDANPIPIHSELMVGSAKHGYAGRFDLHAYINGEVVTKTYPKRAPVKEWLNGKPILELKTSKAVYESYHLQLGGYDGAMVECGYDAPDFTAVVRVTEDGRYELVRGRATQEDFLTVLKTYHVIKGLK